MKQETVKGFMESFGGEAEPHVFFAPGRVNLIGEHTDYNGGYVLPCALNMGTYAAIRKRGDRIIRLQSGNFEPLAEISLDNLSWNEAHAWANYPKGIISNLAEQKYDLSGFDMYFLGDLPNGAGLSSSASVTMVTVTAVDGIYGLNLDVMKKVELCQKAEFYNGVKCGVLDPFASAMGRKNHAVLLNCSSMEYTYVPLNLGEYRIVIANTNKKRGLADSKYNERRAECEEALADLNTVLDIKALCDLEPDDFEKHKSVIKNPIPAKRAEHVIYENYRTKLAAEYIKQGKWVDVLGLTRMSHESLKDLYEVSCDELDCLVNAAYEFNALPEKPPIYAARMTGAGFGGCTVNIVHGGFAEEFTQYLRDKYFKETGITADFYVTEAGGADAF